ncbi:hypothetical protein LJY25_08575 [Hymenobacter sp. BT175]|uniref:hypothetical protein n=1 Tax=Hymenobacter translucens TaxID=2886507 RepID=UPI001D0F1393|nr:hypothetical protein [Hymenobacter translucens]MCC2546495.1 hypothetical protein [Hymenobacter translucens]
MADSKSPTGPVLLLNLLVLLVYSVLTHWLSTDGLGSVLLNALFIALHCFLCLLAWMVLALTGRKETGKDFLLSFLLVLLIGFGSCLGLAGLFRRPSRLGLAPGTGVGSPAAHVVVFNVTKAAGVSVPAGNKVSDCWLAAGCA